MATHAPETEYRRSNVTRFAMTDLPPWISRNAGNGLIIDLARKDWAHIEPHIAADAMMRVQK